MEKHTCKLCFRSFANGRALGGHMRSHVAASNKSAAAETNPAQIHKVYFSSPSASSSSTSEDDDKGYGLRENPKKSCRLVDPDFSSASAAADAAGSYALVQDRESETETSRTPAHRRRSKRARPEAPPPTPDPEPVSSVSDASPEEDVAISLMMLSRDTWKNYNESDKRDEYDDDHEVEVQEEEEEEEEEEELSTKNKLGKSKYQCKTCRKAFRSYQALGGHRASHKKFKSCVPPSNSSSPSLAAARIYDIELAEAANAAGKVVHECPICFRIFASGQALGGHKRSHLTLSAAATITMTPPLAASVPVPVPKFVDTMIDLNLPAPMEDDADRQSAVSDELNWITKRY